LLERFEGEERLDDARFHIENARTVGFARGNAEGHFREGAGRVDRVVMAENQELPRGT